MNGLMAVYWFLNASRSTFEPGNGWVAGGTVSSLVGVESSEGSTNPCGVHSTGVWILRCHKGFPLIWQGKKPGRKTCRDAVSVCVCVCLCLCLYVKVILWLLIDLNQLYSLMFPHNYLPIDRLSVCVRVRLFVYVTWVWNIMCCTVLIFSHNYHLDRVYNDPWLRGKMKSGVVRASEKSEMAPELFAPGLLHVS